MKTKDVMGRTLQRGHIVRLGIVPEVGVQTIVLVVKVLKDGYIRVQDVDGNRSRIHGKSVIKLTREGQRLLRFGFPECEEV
jgi:hypothetical protein